MKLIIPIISMLTAFTLQSALASDNLAISDIEKIYWLNGPQQENAIVYGQFENFNNLINLIEQSVTPSNQVEPSQCTVKSKPDRLMLVGPQVHNYLSLLSNCIQHKNTFYKSDAELLNKYKTVNESRIRNNELIGKRAFKIAQHKNHSSTAP